MITVLDASAPINLINGNVAETVMGLSAHEFAIGPQVFEECKVQRNETETLFRKGLALLPDDDVPASLFLSLLGEHRLGLGETECLALAIRHDGTVCTDDRKARAMCVQVIGAERVFGSARLLRRCVMDGLMPVHDALAAYECMRSKGAFLPAVPQMFFDGFL